MIIAMHKNVRTTSTVRAEIVASHKESATVLAGRSDIINPLGQATRYSYPDEHSQQPSQITDPHNGIRHLTYDRAEQLTSYTDCTSARTGWRHDRWGQVIEVRDAQDHIERWTHDHLGRPLSYTNAAGDIVSITEADGSITNFDLDPWGEATAAWQANTLLWRIERDQARRPITLTNANGERSTFVWDKLDRLIEQTDWTGTTERYQRDRAGQIIQIELIRNEQVILTQTNDLDKAGRVTRVQIQCGQNTYGARITYDAADQIIDIEAVDGASGGHSAVHWDRNPLGHIEQETQFLYGPDNEILWRHQVDHQHDELGNIVHTQLQGLPALHWQTYGPGYVHGLLLGQNSLVDFEHDKLHREIKRSLSMGKITS